MRRRGRKSIIGVASAAGVLAIAIAPAAGVAKSNKPTSNPNLIRCTAKLTSAVPAGQDQVFPNQTPGEQWGWIHCGKGVGTGLEEIAYKIPVSGDEVGTFVAYFKGGTIQGKLDLAPQEGSFSPNGSTATFGFASFAGALKHMSGTGALASAATGTGTATCVANDGVHFKCVEML
jgi:hypothetical protein